MFKVVPDQLKISDGWVRCGHCAEVFDAQLNLHSQAVTAPPVLSAPAPDPFPTGPSDLANLAADVPAVPASVAADAVVARGLTPEDASLHAVSGGATGQDSMAAQVRTPATEPVVDLAELSVAQEPRVDGAGNEPLEPQAPESTIGAATHGVPATAIENGLDVSFIREARRRAFWRRPTVRLGLGTLGLVLMATLCVQVAVDRRDQIAAYRPELRPALEALCKVASCSIQPWRQIDALVIDGSSFNALAPHVYRLALSVKNVAALDVAVPSIELTLTDVGERALLRRVLTPSELGAVATTIKAGGEWPATATVQLAPSVAGVTGYRVLAFYP